MPQKAARNHMLESQIMTGAVNDDGILGALGSVEREWFVPDAFRQAAYVDKEIALGQGRFLLQPLTFARMLKYARLEKHETVLDVGCATGYGAAVLSKLVQKVVALEEDKTLATKAKELLKPYANIECVESALIGGVSKRSPYDAIFVEGAITTLPQALADQLREGGRLFAIEHREAAKAGSFGLGKLVEYKKIKGTLYKTVLEDASAPLLASFKIPKSFEF
jgi:protein-L-isoaspartate(D-aspartate) O-methyltransferase